MRSPQTKFWHVSQSPQEAHQEVKQSDPPPLIVSLMRITMNAYQGWIKTLKLI